MPRRRDGPPAPAKKMLTRAQERHVRRLWRSGGCQQEIARAVGVTVDTLRARLRDQLADLPKRGRGGGWRPPAPDPTPDEVRARLLEVQARWTDEVRELRWVGSSDRAMPRH